MSSDGKRVFISDEDGPYVYQFDRASGQRLRTFALPDLFAIANLSASGVLDMKAALNAAGYKDDLIPAKLEGLAFGEDVMVGGVLKHTLYVANDNDFYDQVLLSDKLTSVTYDNQFFVFAFDATDLGGSEFVQQEIAAIPEPASYALLLAGIGVVGFVTRARRIRG